MRIREARPEDVPLLLTLVRELAVYERMADEAVGTPELLHESLFGEGAMAYALIAEDDEGGGDDPEPVGFALYFFNFSTFLARRGLYLEDLFVRPAYRGRGVGRALLAALAAIAERRRCARMEWVVLDWNAPAIGFYERLGARPLSDWTVFRLSGAPLAALAAENAP